jgi:sulfate transport system ATP-binding protein
VADRIVLMHHGRVEQVGAPQEVYEHPASPFVYGFLGNVNLFHGRVHEGVLDAGGILRDAPDHATAQDAAGTGYVRPHDFEIERHVPGAQGIVARLRHAHAIGPLAQLELEPDDVGAGGGLIEVVMSSERFNQLALREGELLTVRPKRLRVFVGAPDSIDRTPAPAQETA